MSEPQDREAWRENFPLKWEDDEYVTRREFTRFLGLTSLALFLGTSWIAIGEHVKRWRRKPKGAQRIASVDAIGVGTAIVFHYSAAADPAILVRLAADRFVAYDQRCTHLSCPVVYEEGKQRFRCPCHEGFFAVEDGSVLGGPPQRPLAKLTVTIREKEIWVEEQI